MKNRIITISREFGSGGRTIGKKVAEELHIPCYDSNKADCLKVFIHASIDNRAKRIVEVYGERETSPVQRLKEKDKRRAAYHRFYTDMKCGHAQNYHITLDRGVLGIERCVKIIKELY